MPLTITDHYRADRAEAAREKDAIEAKRRVWRMYRNALWIEIERRGERQLGGATMRMRKAKGDELLPIPWPPYWSGLPGEALMELWHALERARYAGE